MPNSLLLYRNNITKLTSDFHKNYQAEAKGHIAKSYLLNSVLDTLSEASLLKDLNLKGGSALQRAYLSPRYSTDLDFACSPAAKIWSRNLFEELGKEFVTVCIRTIAEKFHVHPELITVLSPGEQDIISFFGKSKTILHWRILFPMPEIALTHGRNFRSQYTYTKNWNKKLIKLELVNVKSCEAEIRPIDNVGNEAASSRSKISWVQSAHEIFVEKALALYSRYPKSFKYTDVYDLLWAEGMLEKFSIDEHYPGAIYIQDKLAEQGLSIETAEIFWAENKRKLTTIEHILQGISTYVPQKAYQDFFAHQSQILPYVLDRITRFSRQLHGESWQDPCAAPISLPKLGFPPAQFSEYGPEDNRLLEGQFTAP